MPQRTIVVLHGMPAVGKLTVATRLLAVLNGGTNSGDVSQVEGIVAAPWCLFHNHMVVDDVLTRHTFGSPGFIEERDTMWRHGLTARLGAPGCAGVIFTYSTENTVPPSFLEWLFNGCQEVASVVVGDARPLPQVPIDPRIVSVCLVAPQGVALSRVDTHERKQRMKLQDKSFYEKLIDEGVFQEPPVPRTDLTIDTSEATPDEAASSVASFLFA